MNHDENLTYQWLRNLRDSLLVEQSSSRLSDDQIAKLLYDVGFRDEDLVTAVRIVLGESGGNPAAININTGASGKYKDSRDRGIFQFNDVAFPNISDEEAFNPITAARYAFDVYKRQGGFVPGRSAWWGKTKFHTLKKDGSPDTNRIERAQKAVQNLTGYKSTGNFEYLPSDSGIESGIDPFQPSMGQTTTPSLLPFLAKLISEENGKLIDPKKFKVSDRSKDKLLKKNKNLLRDMLSYFDHNLAFEKPVSIHFVDDEQNFQEPLGRTAYYDPEQSHITIYVTGRLLKDILRSLGHELIHHKQHCNGELDNVNTFEGYAQKDKNLREMEKQAFLEGNMLFRDWEDTYKSNHKEQK